MTNMHDVVDTLENTDCLVDRTAPLSRGAIDGWERAAAAFHALPEMRMDKVAAMRARLALGDYRPAAEELADAILARAGRRAAR